MTLPASQIVRLLITYKSLVVPELDVLNTKSELMEISIYSEYSFVTLDVSGAGDDELICRIKFELTDKAGKIIETYCRNRSLEPTLASNLKKKKFPGFDNKELAPYTWTDEIRHYIDQADEVAHVSSNCTNGDNYRPGNFSKVAIFHDHLELSQINKMNSRSLDHKNDYSMRSLIFIIPLSKNFAKPVVNYKLDDMLVKFDDHSSANNKRCGENIQKVLEELTKSKR